MNSYVSEAQSAVEELKLFLEVDTVEEIKTKLNNLYLVLVLQGLYSDFDHVRDQILTSHAVPSMENLFTRLLHVPLHRQGSRPQCRYCKRIGHTEETCYSLHGSPQKSINVFKIETMNSKFFNDEYQDYLQLKAAQQPQTSTITIAHNSTSISQFGHPSLSKLHKMVPNFNKIKVLNCESCQLGKHV
ncbi:hypothetical protein CDL12_17878 [Handroanthus impetiginosus]|uniref:GAG-pre-integrase domain-containing protein n=1 Tax=Handroanthus impetiginosus TaxID=429701 RepID=A0A2G9GX02_9LAMI|nr:hypothetical protein CDL12_17878 [Handroanthus impetiginosus]